MRVLAPELELESWSCMIKKVAFIKLALRIFVPRPSSLFIKLYLTTVSLHYKILFQRAMP